MSRSRIQIGLEIGTSKVCAVVGQVKSDGGIRILGLGTIPSRGVIKGEVCRADQAAECVYNAVRLAEDQADVTIGSVYLAVTGSEIRGVNHRGFVCLPDERDEIAHEDVDEIKRIAEKVLLPKGNVILHTIIRRFYVDGQEGVEDPVGRMGRQLEADYHVIQGVESRVRNVIRFVQEIPLDVDDIVFAPLAASQVLVSVEEKRQGALVLDLGAGTTDYLLYDQGSVAQSGSIGLGGDHLNNDISMVMKLPRKLAEQLKIQHGNALWNPARSGERVVIEDKSALHGRMIELEELHSIISLRMREILEQVKRPLALTGYLQRVGSGVVLTGGGSLLPGISELVQEVFGLPVLKRPPVPVNGTLEVARDPRFSTAIGLIRFAQLQDQFRPNESILGRFWGSIGNLFGAARSGSSV